MRSQGKVSRFALSRFGVRLWFPKVVIRLGPLAFLALVLQLLAIFGPLGSSDIPRRVLLVSSYPLLLVFVLANLRRPGLVIIGAGLLLNFVAIASNGGLMPVSPDVVERIGPPPENISLGEWLPRSKDVLLAREDTRLWFLTDTLVWNNPTPINGFSVGDVVIAAGLVVILGELFLPRIRRVGRPDHSSDYPSFS